MTSLALATILAASTTHRQLATMPKEDVFVFLQAVNEALMEWHRLAPEWLRKDIPLGANLQGPQAITLTCTAGSTTVAITTSFPLGLFTTSANTVGCTLVFDTSRFRLTSATSLDYPWNGTTGSHTFTIYGDAVQVPSSLSLVKRVVLLESGRETELIPISDDEAAYQRQTFKAGRPEWVNITPGDAIDGSANSFILTAHPAPSADYKLRIERHSLPELMVEADLKADTALPILDQYLVSGFIPLARQYIAESTIARATTNQTLIATAAERVREHLPYTNNPAAIGGQVRTQPGY